MSRDQRQRKVFEWCAATFGHEVATDPSERVRRLLEEAIELAQAEGLARPAAEALLARVYGRPPGEPKQEAGGVGVSLLAYCAARCHSADALETAEVDRILSKSPEHFRARQEEKARLGIARRPEPPPAPQVLAPRQRRDGRGRPPSAFGETVLRMLEVLRLWITPAELAHHLGARSRITHKRLQALYLAGRIARRPRPFRHRQIEYEYAALQLLHAHARSALAEAKGGPK